MLLDDVPPALTAAWLASLVGLLVSAAVAAVNLAQGGRRLRAPYGLALAFASLVLIFIQEARAAADPTFHLVPRSGSLSPLLALASLFWTLVRAVHGLLLFGLLPALWALLLGIIFRRGSRLRGA